MNYYNNYITLVFTFKILFVLLGIAHICFKIKGYSKTNIDNKIIYWKERTEFIFIVLMSCLLIYLFYPKQNQNVVINGETKLLLFLFGLILIITAKWNVFIEDAKWFKTFQQIV
jgi:hypothetical protein